MTVTRTPDIDVERDFTVDIPITKAYVGADGRRHVVGVATGVAEDRDGERCSKNCVTDMGRQIRAGGVKVTSTHQQDWMTEIGDVEKYEYDADTDEMIVDGVLPPEGVDPIADKGWRAANQGKLGWSIGGKLLKSYFERNELGKKRKVLDAIKLKHVCLTQSPAYPNSFAEAVVAKSFTDDDPGDDEFTLQVDPAVEKGLSTGSWVSGGSDSGGGNTGRDSVGSGQRNAGSKDPKSKGMNTEDDGSNDDDDNDDEKLPKAPDERRLACPNCGHEFAADLPLDPEEQQIDDTGNDNDDDQDDTGKSTVEKAMSILTAAMDDLKALAEDDGVAKQTTPEPDVEVTKTDDDGLSDIEKIVAASYVAQQRAREDLEKRTAEGFELIAKAFTDLKGLILDMPQGRQSVARVIPPPDGHGELGKGGREQEVDVEKEIADADNPLEALKAANAANWGVRGNNKGVLARTA